MIGARKLLTKRTKAFTLIELLVVVAILALLAALLFPALSSARNSSLQSKCISNFRQAFMAMSLYTDDNNDLAIPASSNPSVDATSRTDKKWPQLIQPYLSEKRVFRCPRDQFPSLLPAATFDPDIVGLDPSEYDYQLAQRTNVGYNYLLLSPIVRNDNRWMSIPKLVGAVASASDTILAVDSVWRLNSNNAPTGGGHYLVVPPCRFQQEAGKLIDALAIPESAEAYMAHPGWDRVGAVFKAYGGAYPWHDGRMTTLFLDGHVSSLPPGRLSEGCDVQRQLSGFISDSTEYLWDIQ